MEKLACIVDHHFNAHGHCSVQWCKVLKMKENGEEMSNNERRKQYGMIDNPKYDAFKAALSSYFTAEALCQVHHSFSSQKDESLNRKVMQFAPKDKLFCGSFSLFDCLYLVVIEDSIGLEKGIGRTHEALGILTNPLLKRWCQITDRDNNKKVQQQRKLEEKRKRVEKQKHLYDAEQRTSQKAKHDGVEYGVYICAPCSK
jgi:hypothetical protein